VEIVLEILIELLLELVIYVVFELLAAGALHPIAARRERAPPHPLVRGLAYAVLGGALGGVSVLVWPSGLLHDEFLRVASVIVSPLAAGGAMALLGRYLKKRDRPVVALESFGYGFAFAAAFGVVRFFATATV
jgi:hypothetical protein